MYKYFNLFFSLWKMMLKYSHKPNTPIKMSKMPNETSLKRVIETMKTTKNKPVMARWVKLFIGLKWFFDCFCAKSKAKPTLTPS